MRFNVELTEEESKELFLKAGLSGVTAEELLQSFAADLVGSVRSNGSDERMFATEWYDRRFGCVPETFLGYLIKDDATECLKKISLENEIKELQALKISVMASRGKTYPWESVTYSDGTPVYSSKEEWEKEQESEIDVLKDELESYAEQFEKLWKEYSERNKQSSFDEEMRIISEWIDSQKR